MPESLSSVSGVQFKFRQFLNLCKGKKEGSFIQVQTPDSLYLERLYAFCKWICLQPISSVRALVLLRFFSGTASAGGRPGWGYKSDRHNEDNISYYQVLSEWKVNVEVLIVYILSHSLDGLRTCSIHLTTYWVSGPGPYAYISNFSTGQKPVCLSESRQSKEIAKNILCFAFFSLITCGASRHSVDPIPPSIAFLKFDKQDFVGNIITHIIFFVCKCVNTREKQSTSSGQNGMLTLARSSVELLFG